METKDFQDLLAQELKSFKEGLSFLTKEEMEAKMTDLEASLESKYKVEVKDFTPEFNEFKSSLETAFKELEAEVKKGSQTQEVKTISDVLLSMWEEKGIKKASDLKKFREFESGIEFKAEVPTITTAQTGTIGRTDMVTLPRFANERPLAFLPSMRVSPISSGKSIIGWTTGAYTSYCGYLGENSANATNDAATALEKTRGLAKISAIKIITTELEEDLPELARAMEMKMIEQAQIFLDNEIYTGDGNPDTNANPTHIYGLQRHATAFSVTPFIGTITAVANASDLADAMNTQAVKVHHKITKVWMNPDDVYKLRRTKDTTGQYIINQLITGELVLNGITVVPTTAVTANTMLGADESVLQLRVKRELTFKVGQFGDDAKYDRSSALLFMRAQVLVEDEDRKAVIYVSDINAALQSMEVGS
jgi:HK97 family phage major capsid protein